MKKKIKYIIYDSTHKDILTKIINTHECEVLNFREFLNSKKKFIFFFFYILKNFYNIKLMNIMLKDGFLTSYVCKQIYKYNPKFVITMIDNDLRFYKLKKYFNNSTKFVAIQNGLRSKFHDIFDNPTIHKDKNLSADYYLSFGTSLKTILQKYIKVKVIPVGSIVNNMVKIKKFSYKISKNNILYISSYRNLSYNQVFDKSSDGQSIYWKNLISDEIKLIKYLGDYCYKNNIELGIAGCNLEFPEKEKKFFKKILRKVKWKFYKRINKFSNYKLIDNFNIIVNNCSTLGFEALGRDKKVAFFSREKSPFGDWRFGWPIKYPLKGFFYSNRISEFEVNRILNNLCKINQKQWNLMQIKEKNIHMRYDPKNLKIQSLIK